MCHLRLPFAQPRENKSAKEETNRSATQGHQALFTGGERDGIKEQGKEPGSVLHHWHNPRPYRTAHPPAAPAARSLLPFRPHRHSPTDLGGRLRGASAPDLQVSSSRGVGAFSTFHAFLLYCRPDSGSHPAATLFGHPRGKGLAVRPHRQPIERVFTHPPPMNWLCFTSPHLLGNLAHGAHDEERLGQLIRLDFTQI
ncbi:hypothetical protein NDU88_001284 [Pleurodeles waltl]|uniref:Uncharacterized protein n=1 Tax=Pleurodeles waltl TaxID=8319 RepID=A0AAV7M7S5_PLEWA|nr:hypothetical protein NDU88_001284 [Pleurodeles waltl]